MATKPPTSYHCPVRKRWKITKGGTFLDHFSGRKWCVIDVYHTKIYAKYTPLSYPMLINQVHNSTNCHRILYWYHWGSWNIPNDGIMLKKGSVNQFDNVHAILLHIEQIWIYHHIDGPNMIRWCEWMWMIDSQKRLTALPLAIQPSFSSDVEPTVRLLQISFLNQAAGSWPK